MEFQIHALSPTAFAPLFDVAEGELVRRRARKMKVDEQPGFPCRVSLEDANVGEEVLLLNYRHRREPTPFQATHAIFVRRGAVQATPGRGEIPAVLRSRLLSLRGFDSEGMLRDGDVVEGDMLEDRLSQMLAGPAIATVDIHNARLGCYLARATRAPDS